MEYLENEGESFSKEGWTVSIILHLLLLLIFWFLYIKSVPPKMEGMVINFGVAETGMGEETPQPVEEAMSPPPTPVQEVEEVAEEAVAESIPETETPEPAVENEVLEVKDVEAPALPVETPDKKEEATKEKVKEKKEDKEEPAKKEEEKEEEKPKEEVKPELEAGSLFKNRKDKEKDSNNATSQGTSTNNSDQGTDVEEDAKENSDVYTPSRNIGMHDKGSFKYDLQGRNLVHFPDVIESSQKEGKVVVKIKVDTRGNVISAEYTSRGSTTSDSALKQAAIKAAKEARFNFSPSAPAVQIGTVSFTFKVQ